MNGRTSCRHNTKGLTFLEILIVILIIGALALIAIPNYLAVLEQSKRSESCSLLGAIRKAELRYQGITGVYTNVWNNLDIEMPIGKYFTFTIVLTGAAGPRTIATRNTVEKPPLYGTYQETMSLDTGITTQTGTGPPGGC